MKTLFHSGSASRGGRVLLGLALGALSLAGCKKNEDVTVQTPTKAPSNPITSSTITGNVKGTLLSSVGTYTITSDVKVGPKDTLIVQNGVRVNVTNNARCISRACSTSKALPISRCFSPRRWLPAALGAAFSATAPRP